MGIITLDALSRVNTSENKPQWNLVVLSLLDKGKFAFHDNAVRSTSWL